MCAHKPWAVKIATTIADYKDLLIHRDLQDWMKSKMIRSIVLGMGDRAHFSRITSPCRNALTYTFLAGTDSAATGQLSLAMHRLSLRGSSPALFGIIGGDQVVHSLSPLIHNLLFHKHKINAIYSSFPTDDFKGTMKILEKLGIAGLSVTAPFKHDAFALADQVDPIGKKLGTVNTLIKKNGIWKAFNTDVIGVERGYPFLKSAQSIAILGAGGVVHAVIEGIRKINPETFITVFARDPKKAAKDLERSSVSIQPISKINDCIADVVICAVSQDIVLPLPRHGKKSIAIDLRYGKKTKFMKSAAAKGFRVYDGLPMLLHQALAQFKLFTGIAAESIPLPSIKKILIR
jgi:shikimate dehydrogenase